MVVGDQQRRQQFQVSGAENNQLREHSFIVFVMTKLVFVLRSPGPG